MTRISLVLALAIAACVVFTNPADAQTAPWLTWATDFPKSGSKGYVKVQGKIKISDAVKFTKVYGMAAKQGFNALFGAPTELPLDLKNGTWGGVMGTELRGATGTYNNGDVLQIVIYAVDDKNNYYLLIGQKASGQ